MDTAATRCVRSSPAIRAAKPLSELFTTSGERVTAAAKHRVALGDLDDETAAAFAHVGRRMLGGDEVREDRLAQGVGAVGEIGLPEASPSTEQGVLAGDAVDEHVEAAVVTGDAREHRLDLELDRMVDAYGDASATGRRHHPRGLVDGFGPVVGRAAALNASPGAIDGGAGLAEAPRDAAAGPPRGAGDECDLSGQWLFRRHGRSPGVELINDRSFTCRIN